MTHQDPPFTVELRSEPDCVVVAPRGELDMATVDRVRADVDAAVASGSGRIVLDLRGVTFLDSTGLRMLFTANAAAQRHGAELAVVDGGPRVGRILELAGAWRVLRRADARV